MHAGNITFALLNEYVLHLTGQPLPRPIRQYVDIHDSQVFRQPDTDQSTIENPQHCGQCLLHAVCGRLKFHEMLVPLFDFRETVCILTVPPSVNCGSTFGRVAYGQSRVVRKLQFHPRESFYHGLNIRGGGCVEDVAQQRSWSPNGHWEGVNNLVDFFMSKGNAFTKRLEGSVKMHPCQWILGITLPTKRWLPPDILGTEKHSGVLPPFAIAVHGLGRWCFEELFTKECNSLVGRYQQVVKVLPPPYISGCTQWPDIKTDAAFIHPARMWIALRLVDTIHRFVDCILSAQHNASASTRMLSAAINTFSCLLYTSPSPRDLSTSRMPSSA